MLNDKKGANYSRLFLVLNGFLFSGLTHSTDLHSLSISALTPYFNYTEYSSNGTILDSEKGWLKGASIAYDYDFENRHAIKVHLTKYTGKVSYEGHTQSGAEHNTKTHTSIKQQGIAYMYQPFDHSSYRVGVEISNHRWNRSIQAKGSVLGLSEVYQWQRLGIYQEVSLNNLVISISPSLLVNAEMEVDLTSIGDNKVIVPLKQGYEIDACVKMSHTISDDVFMYMTTSFIWRYFSESDSVISGSRIISEPENELFQPQLTLGIQFNID